MRVMIKVTAAAFYFVFITMSLHAEVKWIPIEPIDSNKKPKQNIELPRTPQVDNLIENVKVVQQLLERGENQETKRSGEEKWFLLEDIPQR